jgi:hypothetical protein
VIAGPASGAGTTAHGKARGERVRTATSGVRDSLILGHHLAVYFREEDQWHVVIDGEERAERFPSAYAAWAAGAAESYRKGRTVRTPPSGD